MAWLFFRCSVAVLAGNRCGGCDRGARRAAYSGGRIWARRWCRCSPGADQGPKSRDRRRKFPGFRGRGGAAARAGRAGQEWRNSAVFAGLDRACWKACVGRMRARCCFLCAFRPASSAWQASGGPGVARSAPRPGDPPMPPFAGGRTPIMLARQTERIWIRIGPRPPCGDAQRPGGSGAALGRVREGWSGIDGPG